MAFFEGRYAGMILAVKLHVYHSACLPLCLLYHFQNDDMHELFKIVKQYLKNFVSYHLVRHLAINYSFTLSSTSLSHLPIIHTI